MKLLKLFIKKYFPRLFYILSNIKGYFDEYLINREIILNYYSTNYDKNALLSYITLPFKKQYIYHTNCYEARSWAKILFELGYNVDIIDFRRERKLELAKYDLILGFGDVFQTYFESNINKHITTIYYGGGMHVCHQNHASLNRVKDVYHKRNVWLGKSARFVEKTWSHQTTLVDAIIALGNNVCADSYRKYYDGRVYSLACLFFKTQNAEEIIKNRSKEANKSFLWFGSAGLVHKGLDLLLDYFYKNTDLTLHICGLINNEREFVNVYKNELFNTPNIIVHGFIDIASDTFCDILKSSSFVILPSCSEGGAPSVLTAIGNGGLIPIITKETSISTGSEIWIDSYDNRGIDMAVKNALKLTNDEIIKLQYLNYQYVLKHNTQEKYYEKLMNIVKEIIT